MLMYGYGFELAVCAVAFAVMAWSFATTFTLETRVSLTTLAGYDCTVLNPSKATTPYSSVHSENAQFASPYMKQTECESYLASLKLCDDGVRLDHISVFGVTNPADTQYYQTGYLSFTPTQIPGQSSALTCIYGCSVSFPLPAFGQSLPGSATNWYLFSFARGTSSSSVAPFPSIAASTLLHDPATNKVYDPSPISPLVPKDYDLSSSAAAAATPTNVVQALKDTMAIGVGSANVVLKASIVVDIGVFNGVYYGYVAGQKFSKPTSVATLSEPAAQFPESPLSLVYITEHDGYLVMVDSGGALTRTHAQNKPYFSQANAVALPPEAYGTGYSGTGGTSSSSSTLTITAASSGLFINGMALRANGLSFGSVFLSNCNINSGTRLGTCDMVDVTGALTQKSISLLTPLRGSTEVIYLGCGSTVYKVESLGSSAASGDIKSIGNLNAYNPVGAVTLDGSGMLYVAETDGSKVSKVATTAAAAFTAYSGTASSNCVSGVAF